MIRHALIGSLVTVLAACSGGHAEVSSDPHRAGGSAAGEPTPDGPSTPVSPETPAPTASASGGGVDASGKIGGAKLCTEIGCTDRLAVHVTGKITKGELMITAKVGDTSLHCVAQVDDQGLLKPLAADACKGDAALALRLPGQPLSGSPPAGVTPIFSLVGKAAPASVELLLVRGRATLHKETLTPAYQLRQPNGPDCPPSCKQADLVVTVK